MIYPVVYCGRYSWGHAGNSINRPYSELVFPLAGAKSLRLWALVDTGADYLQLDSHWAASLGINPATQGTATNVTLAGGGTLQCRLVPGVSVTIEGKTIVADCLFSPTPRATPILGRLALLAAIDVGFDTRGWLYG